MESRMESPVRNHGTPKTKEEQKEDMAQSQWKEIGSEDFGTLFFPFSIEVRAGGTNRGRKNN